MIRFKKNAGDTYDATYLQVFCYDLAMYEAFKPLGLLSIAIAWASLFFLVTKWPGSTSMSVSKRAAASRSAYASMAVMESIFLPMYLAFIATWFVHTFELPTVFTVLNAISVIGLLFAAWVPDVGGAKGKIHNWVCYPAYASMPIATLLVITSSNTSNFARFYGVFALAVMLVCGVRIALKSKLGKNKFLLLQGLFLASVHSTILAATYVR
jgi:hypothetical protein